MRRCIGCGTKLDPNDNKEYIYCTAACANYHVYRRMGKKQRHSWLDSFRHYWRSRLHSWRYRLHFWLDTWRSPGSELQATPEKIKEPIDFIHRVEEDTSPLPPAWKEAQALAKNIKEDEMIKVQQNEQGESYILLPTDLLERFEWREGDDIELQTVEVGERKSLILSNTSKILRRAETERKEAISVDME